MKNKQFEDNIVRLLKTSRESNMPSEDFVNNLIDDALNEFEPNLQKRQKGAKPHLPGWFKVAAVLILCSGLVCSVVIQLGRRVERRFQGLDSKADIRGQDLPETEGLSE